METRRYVVLRHEGIEQPHLDLMFETSEGSKLRTWRSPSWPPALADELTELGEHRAEYLDYEGPLTRGRGYVRRVARGTCRIERNEPDTFVAECSDGMRIHLTRAPDGRWRSATGE
jgi:hypothetical protein